MKLDAKVKPVVLFLNEKEINTYQSCQGHKTKDGVSQAYVVYDTNFIVDNAFRKAGFRVVSNTAVISENKDTYGKEIYGVSLAEIYEKYDSKKFSKIWNNVLDILKEKL